MNSKYKYIVRKSVPIKNSVWKADLREEEFIATCLNDLIAKCITGEEIRLGVKVVSIMKFNGYQLDILTSWKK